MGTWVHLLLGMRRFFTFISCCARETERKKRPTPTKFSDENGYTGNSGHLQSTRQMLYPLQTMPEYPGSQTHHDELTSLLGRCSALSSSPEGSSRERRYVFCHDSRPNRHKASDKNVPRRGFGSSSNFGRGSTASLLLQLRRQELSSVRFSFLSQTPTAACVPRPLAVKSPHPLAAEPDQNLCTSGAYSDKRTNT